jgi:hypothetical protein
MKKRTLISLIISPTLTIFFASVTNISLAQMAPAAGQPDYLSGTVPN